MTRQLLEWVTPLPPLPTGIAGYSADLLAVVQEPWNIKVTPEPAKAGIFGRPITGSRPATRQILQVGNSGFHPLAYRLAENSGNLLVLHDVVLHHARLASFVSRRGGKAYIELMSRLYGPDGLDAARAVLRGGPIDGDRFPLSEDLIERANVVAVHSEHARQRVLELRPETNVVVIPMGIPLPYLTPQEDARAFLNLPQDAFVVVSITHVNPMKRIPVVLRAFRRLLRTHSRSLFVIAGGASDPDGLKRQVRALGLENHVRIAGYVTDDEARLLARAGDVAVNLRYPSTGETSASLLRLLGAGIPVVVTRHGSSLEVPEKAALHLSVDLLEEETLAEYLKWLADDHDARAEIGANARAFVAEQHSMGVAADGYREAVRLAWGIDLPVLVQRVVEEPAPIMTRPGPAVEENAEPSRIEGLVASRLVRLGIGGHDGTIEAVARQMDRLEMNNVASDSSNQEISPDLLEVLACPVCKTNVKLEDGELVCPSCGRRYQIRDGIPVMLAGDE
jgi:glycosyltransferase involved in cell wall biosynthesis/uncharacterized protein YbaR (Trm112 family)